MPAAGLPDMTMTATAPASNTAHIHSLGVQR
ncbi:Uncharacterised protein [Mycobacterium tuberculosis]|uniref:Uncharacterized protein n=1 Tax=Mycobacterium tuberculosis TaxID=1773 RepID=A0A655AJ80_MYCTX|nr:Uncharacterised protein [Mycobacterium tuberculosis]CKT67606.1 Uncharacterised protein [Mycobacterium tuberculosis]CKV19606.1 Uncharacterised protein [Mycobacterium tuberculosis]CPA68322.1 Uncharacterised protein [Mycobacterium tuberculosis]